MMMKLTQVVHYIVCSRVVSSSVVLVVSYTITGTAVVSGPATPGQTKDMPFTIEAPC